MLTDKEYSEYRAVFEKVQGQSQKFLARFPNFPDLSEKKILEIGCGHGALCYELVQRGAALVVGADLDEKRIEFAQKHLPAIAPELSKRLLFTAQDIAALADTDFDLVISKSTFEHVMDLEGLLRTIARLMKKGGKLYCGFGPLYYSFDGDHNLITRCPWGHLLLPDHVKLRKFERKTGSTVSALRDMTFNMLPFREYERIFAQSDFAIDFFAVNVSTNPLMKLFSLLRFNALFRELFSRNIYCVLVKK